MVKASENFRIHKDTPTEGGSHRHLPSPGLSLTNTVLQPSKSTNLPSVNMLKGTTKVYHEGEPIDFDNIVKDSVVVSPSKTLAPPLPALIRIDEGDTSPTQSGAHTAFKTSDQHTPEAVLQSNPQPPRGQDDLSDDVEGDFDDLDSNSEHTWPSEVKSRFSTLVLENSQLRVSDTNELELIAIKNIRDNLIKEYPEIDPKRFDVQLLLKRLKNLASLFNNAFFPLLILPKCSYDPKTHHLNYRCRKSKSDDEFRKQIIKSVKHDLEKKNIYNIDPRVFIKFFTTNCDYLMDIKEFVLPEYITRYEFTRGEAYDRVRQEQEESLAELKRQGESLRRIQNQCLIEATNKSIDEAKAALLFLRNRRAISEEENDILLDLISWETIKTNSAVLIKLSIMGECVTSLGCEKSDDGVSQKDLHHLEVLTNDLLGFANRRGYFKSKN